MRYGLYLKLILNLIFINYNFLFANSMIISNYYLLLLVISYDLCASTIISLRALIVLHFSDNNEEILLYCLEYTTFHSFRSGITSLNKKFQN